MTLDSTVLKTFEELPEEKQNEVIDFIFFLSVDNKKKPQKITKPFPFDGLKGEPYYISDDFDEPLNDFKEYM